MTKRGANVAKALRKREAKGLHIGRPRKKRPVKSILKMRKLGMTLREIAIANQCSVWLVFSTLQLRGL